jgi:hypothetical protein
MTSLKKVDEIQTSNGNEWIWRLDNNRVIVGKVTRGFERERMGLQRNG